MAEEATGAEIAHVSQIAYLEELHQYFLPVQSYVKWFIILKTIPIP